MSYRTALTFPIRYLNEDVRHVLEEENELRDQIYAIQENEGVPAEKRGEKPFSMDLTREALLYHSETENLAYIEHEDNRYGEYEELQKVLEAHNIPYDFDRSEGEGYGPIHLFYRPGWDKPVRRSLTMDGDYYVPVYELRLLMDMKADDAMDKLKQLIAQSSSDDIPNIEDYTAETDFGRNKTAMNDIDTVLAKLDNGELSEEDAFAQIKDIRREATKETKPA